MKRTEVKLVLTGNSTHLNRELGKSSKHIRSFGRKTTSSFRSIRRGIGRTIGKIGALAAAFGLYRMGKAVFDLNRRIRELKRDAGDAFPIGDMQKYKDLLVKTALAAHIDPKELLTAQGIILEKIGQFEFAKKTMEIQARVILATGADPEDVGAIAANLREKFKMSPEGLKRTFDVIIAQGKQGAFVMKHFAAQSERLLSAPGRLGLTGEKGLNEFTAWIQLVRRRSGSAEQAATAIDRAVTQIAVLAGQMPKLVFDVDESGIKKYKSFAEILKGIFAEIAKKPLEERTAVTKNIFGMEGLKAAEDILFEYVDTGKFETYEKLIKLGGDGKALMADFNLMADDTLSKVQDVSTRLFEAFDKLFTPERVEALGEALDKLNDILGKINKQGLTGVINEAVADQLLQQALGPRGYKPYEPLVIKGLVGGIPGPQFFNPSTIKGNYGPRIFDPTSIRERLGETVKSAPEHIINLEVNIKPGRVSTRVDDMNTKVNVKAPRGEF